MCVFIYPTSPFPVPSSPQSPLLAAAAPSPSLFQLCITVFRVSQAGTHYFVSLKPSSQSCTMLTPFSRASIWPASPRLSPSSRPHQPLPSIRGPYGGEKSSHEAMNTITVFIIREHTKGDYKGKDITWYDSIKSNAQCWSQLTELNQRIKKKTCGGEEVNPM